MKNFKASLLSLSVLAVLSSACLKGNKSSADKPISNLVRNDSSSVNQSIGDEKIELQVISQSEFELSTAAGKILTATSPEGRRILDALPQTKTAAEALGAVNGKSAGTNDESLLIGFPIGLIGEQSVFGGVITKVTDKTSETLGSLKLTDLSPLHVRTAVSMSQEKPFVTLIGCPSDCDENSEQGGLINFPIMGIDEKAGKVYLDLSSVGKELDLMAMLDPTGAYTKLRSVSSATTAFDYSFSTLVFDIKTKMAPVGKDPTDPATPITEFTVRWYLRLNSAFNPAFVARGGTPGVGYFTTERSKNPKITRFSTTNFGQTIKYYIKNVPEAYKPPFAEALKNWNSEFQKIIGRDLLSYEFIDAADPRAAELVAGDIRYNIIEWDLENVASYGGLGPSVANQFTGETLSANVLVQGPTIISLYTKWFELSKNARRLVAEGKPEEAEAMARAFNTSASQTINKRGLAKFALKLGHSLSMNIHSQRAELEDPMIKNHFEVVPEGITFDDYMKGYFTEMIEHEVGHNLGLRHNFKGNLGAYETGEKGSVSRSIMEYLGRPYRHLSQIGLYDRMAIGYGYKGTSPTRLNWYCSDEHQASTKETMAFMSPECTKNDATSDPFSFWEARLDRVLDLLIDLNSSSAPVWTAKELQTQIDETITGILIYATSAEKTRSTWTNFFGKGDRPEDVAGIKEYVLAAIKKKICSAKNSEVIASKESAEAIKLAQENFDALNEAIKKKSLEVAVFTEDQLRCVSAP